jgi:hypothetical protein
VQGPFGTTWRGLRLPQGVAFDTMSRFDCQQGASMSSVVKKRRKKIRKHKYKKMRKKTRWARMHK